MIVRKTNQEAYREIYCKQVEPKNRVTIMVYRAIINGFSKFIIRKVFEGFDVELSAGNTLGALGMRGKKQKPKIVINENGKELIKGLLPDWKATKAYWAKRAEELGITYDEFRERYKYTSEKAIIYYENGHSNGILYKIRWLNFGTKLVNKSYYSISPTYHNKRAVPEYIRNGQEYLIVNTPNYDQVKGDEDEKLCNEESINRDPITEAYPGWS